MVLYGCETRSLTLRVKHRLSVFEKMVMRKIFGLKKYEVIEENRAMRNFITCTPCEV
jgi:hypothetical protein